MDAYGRTKLMYAANAGNAILIKDLLAKDATNINNEDDFGYTAFKYALNSGRLWSNDPPTRKPKKQKIEECARAVNSPIDKRYIESMRALTEHPTFRRKPTKLVYELKRLRWKMIN